MAEVLGHTMPLDTCQFLQPGATAKDLVAWLEGLKEDVVMAVGHMPDVADMVGDLVSGQGGLEMEFKKAAVCCVSFDGAPAAGKGRLVWLLQPRQLRALAGR